MERNTIIAVVLSTLVLVGFFVMQNSMAAKQQLQQHERQNDQSDQTVLEKTDSGIFADEKQSDIIETQQVIENEIPAEFASAEIEEDTPQEIEHITIETNTVIAVLTNEGGDMISWKLKEHEDKDEKVNMIFRGDNESLSVPASSRAFTIALGGMEVKPISNLFSVDKSQSGSSDQWVEFSRDFIVAGKNEKFRLIKRYEFKPNDYMFKLTVIMDGLNTVNEFNFAGNAYTLSFGPQIGPRFDKLDARYDYRQYFAYTNNKRKKVRVNSFIDESSVWAAISGKYFTFIAIPHPSQYTAIYTETPEPGVPSTSRLSIIRPAQRVVSDVHYFYLGPKSQEALAVYHTGVHGFNFKNSSLTEAASSRGILSPLERLLKWLLRICYKIAPNWGVAIILLTLLIKILFFPLTKKSSEATSRMQELSPKIKELQEKYKGNPQKLNAEMAQFYQKEGYNPLSGCLPMLLQIPIFIAMYSLFNNHFDLRGASFIPGWIPDLSLPEHIINFPDGFRVPILGWTALRGLPFIYVGSQLLYGKFTQTPGQQSQGQMKMMLYVMPLMFFFILYNVPSGLLIYWIFSNIFTLAQQIIINKYKHAKALQNPQTVIEEPKNRIAPKKKRR